MSLFLERMVVDEDARAICLDKPIKGLELQLFNSGANMRPYTTARNTVGREQRGKNTLCR